jgi:hypothetical protein
MNPPNREGIILLSRPEFVLAISVIFFFVRKRKEEKKPTNGVYCGVELAICDHGRTLRNRKSLQDVKS